MTAPDPVVAVIAEILAQPAWGVLSIDVRPMAEVVAAAVREAGLAAPAEPTCKCGHPRRTHNSVQCTDFDCPCVTPWAVVAEGEQ